MSIKPVGSIFNLSPNQVESYTEKHKTLDELKIEPEVDFSSDTHVSSTEIQTQPESPPVWYFSGSYPFRSEMLPCKLAVEHNKKLHDFRNKVVGLILPYSHGFDNEPNMGVSRSDLNFLHLFNLGNTVKSFSGIVDGIAFSNIYIPAMKRISLESSTQRKLYS